MATTDTTLPANNNINPDTFLQTLQQSLINQSGMVSSQNTNIEDTINKAVSGVSSAGASTGQQITSSFDRQIGYAKQDQANTITQSQEKQRGYGVNVAALREVVSSTDKQVNDLESRKQEALLANDSATASKLADLQLQALQFKQKATQDTFNNLLSMTSLASTISGQAEQKRQFNVSQSAQEKQAISSIALQFGLPVREGDTLDSITSRAAPFASERQRLELAKTKAQINQANAEATKALRGDTSSVDPLTISLIAQAGLRNPSALGLIKDPTVAAKVQLEMDKQSQSTLTGKGLSDTLATNFNSGLTEDDTLKQITDNKFLTPAQQATSKKAAIDYYAQQQEQADKAQAALNSKKAPYTASPVGFFSNNQQVY